MAGAPFTGAQFTYDGDGRLVRSIMDGVTTYYPAAHYQKETGGGATRVVKYYAFGGQTVAMRTNETLNWLVSDHLGSNSLATDAQGGKISEVRYSAWGEVRYAWSQTPGLPTDRTYTGQRSYIWTTPPPRQRPKALA